LEKRSTGRKNKEYRRKEREKEKETEEKMKQPWKQANPTRKLKTEVIWIKPSAKQIEKEIEVQKNLC
jgi:hypothetical protein